jgi:hypothetical protein
VRRLHNVSDLPRRALLVVDAAIGKASEAAVGIEEYLFRPVVFQCSFRISHNLIDGFNLLGPWIHNTQPNLPIRKRFPDHIHIACARRGIFQDELFDSNLGKAGNERFIISRKQHFLGAAPVAATNVKSRSNARDSFNYPIQKLGGILQLRTRITASRQGRSHEGSPLIFFGENDFGEHRLIELHELASLTHQVKKLLPEDLYDIISKLLLVIIDL